MDAPALTKATDGTSAVVLTVLTALIGGLVCGETAVVADFGRAQWIGSDDGGRPTSTYWCKDLHQ
jgi:hypothetical protein